MKAGVKRRICASQSGQTLLELALLMPLFLLLLMGIFDVGRYMYMYIIVCNAARAGAAYGAQGQAQSGDTGHIAAAAQNDYQNSGGGNSALTVSSSATGVCDNSAGATPLTCAAGHWIVTVTVTTQATFNALFAFPGIPSSITVNGAATLRVAPIG